MEKNKIYTLRKYLSGSVHDIENLSRIQISCVAPKLFNDPVDTYFYYSDAKCFIESKKILTYDIMNMIRISCFINHANIIKKKKDSKLSSSEILMWTHYANSHKGICLEFSVPAEKFDYLDKNRFDENKVFLNPIYYQENLATDFESIFSDMEDDTYSKDNFEELLRTCFFTKDKSFSYEDEIRLLKYTDMIDNNYIPFKFNYFTKVIFGKRCEEDMKYLVQCLNKQVYKNKLELYEINDHFQEVRYGK